MKNKLLLSTALVGGLMAGSAAIAQTSVTGNLAINYRAQSFDGTNSGLSTRGFARETQVNIQNKGKLNNGLDYAAGFVPEFSITLMPGLVKNHEHAQRINASPFMKDIKKMINDQGAIVLADAWFAGGFASKKTCVTNPDSMKGQVTRAAGPMFEEMLVGAGASISSMASSEVYQGLQTGVLNAVNTSSQSFVSFKLFEQVKCITPPGKYALWFMYQPVLMSKKSFDKLNPKQKEAILAAGKKAEQYITKESAKLDSEMEKVFKEKGVQIHQMTEADFNAWIALAKKTSYKKFAEKVKGGDQLIAKALAVK